MSKRRQMGLEFLRIIAMAAIVAGHFRFQNDVSGGFAVLFLTSGVNIAVNAFLLIGTWFMVDSGFKPLRPIRLHMTLLLYSWLLLAMCGGGLQYALQGVFPFLGCALWFASAYIILLLLSPFLQLVSRLSDAQSAFVCLAMPALVSCIESAPWMGCAGGFSGGLLWFVCVYLFMHHLKHRTTFFRAVPSVPCLLLSLLAYVGMVVCLSTMGLESPIYIAVSHWRSTIQSLPNFLIALGVFIGFLRLKRDCPQIIQVVSSSTFAIYVIHQMPCFMMTQWTMVKRLLPFSMDSEWHTVLDICLVVILLFAVYVPVDRFRIRFVESKLLHSRFVQSLERRIAASVGNSCLCEQ